MLVVLVWRLPDVRWTDLGPRWSSASVWLLAGAALSMFVAFALSTERWRRVLDAMCPAPPFARMFSHFLAGQFVSNVLPTAFGGDVVRVGRLRRDIDDAPRAFASVTIERLTGWLVLPVISLTALAAQPRLTRLGAATTLSVAISVGTLVGLMTLVAVASNRRFSRDLDEMTSWKRFFVAIHLGIDALRRAPTSAVLVVAAGAAFQLAQCLAVWLAALAIGLDEVTIGVVLAFFPAAAIAQNLPVGFGGLGVREGIFVVFFGAVGAPRGLAITLGLVVYGLTILTSSLGAPSFVTGGPSSRRTEAATTG